MDFRIDGFNPDIYAQRVDAAGTGLWTADGVALCSNAGDQFDPVIASDGLGGLVAAWDDTRSGNHDIYGQRVTATGVVSWAANGVPICTAAGTQASPAIVSSVPGEAIVAWEDLRFSTFNADLYAQRVDSSGVVMWTPQGLAVSSANGDQATPTLASDAAGGAFVAWEDGRSGTSADIYAMRIAATGVVGPSVSVPPTSTAAFRVFPPTPNPSRARSSFTFLLPAAARVSLDVLDLEGRRVRTLASESLNAGAHTRVWDGRDDAGALVSIGMYVVRVRTATGVGMTKLSIVR
jgi:hypothetical protein